MHLKETIGSQRLFELLAQEAAPTTTDSLEKI